MYNHMSNGVIIMSGRHLQHGDETQPTRSQEVFTNCATACTSFASFYLLMNGCFRKGTLIHCNGSLKKIEDIKPGQLVLTLDENTLKFTHNIVEKVHINLPKPMVELIISDGKPIVCTEDHLFLTRTREWVEAKNLVDKYLYTTGRVIKVNVLGDTEEEVYDLTVKDSHNYVIGEHYTVVHNSGVGRSYDDDLMIVNWDNAPNIRCVLDEKHPDFDHSAHESYRDAKHKYGDNPDILWHDVEDTREGWGKAVEVWELAVFEKIHKDKLLIFNFSNVRSRNTPIIGMQGRPASGPVPLMNAFNKVASIKGANLPKWRQAMYVDHYFAECVLVAGSRRSARMSTKYWKDKTVLDFIVIKRPIEFIGKSLEEIKILRKNGKFEGFLWSSNNSVMVDEEFWTLLDLEPRDTLYYSEWSVHARNVFDLLTEASYGDGTGEPGVINVDKLGQSKKGLTFNGDFIGSKKYKIQEDTQLYLQKIMNKVKKKKYFMIVNPCSEVNLSLFSGFCVIGDLVPYHADTIDQIEDACRSIVRSLIRVNTMDSIYKKEVERTNRIGVGATGIHEFAWKFFKFGFYDLLDEYKSKDFWMTISRFKRIIQIEAIKESLRLGLEYPQTDTILKPCGTNAKLFGLTEAANLSSMPIFLRWVQFSSTDPLVQVYREKGYPTKDLIKYHNTTIVGFPTTMVISTLGMGDKLVTAGQVSMEDHYKWLMLLEKYWLRGVNEDGTILKLDTGGQISYTVKYKPENNDYNLFRKTLKKYQSQIKCASVMPQEDNCSYEYLPEQKITRGEYEDILSRITLIAEDVDKIHIDCATGACPINFQKEEFSSKISQGT